MTQTEKRGPGRPPGSSGQQGKAALLEATRELLAERGRAGLTLREVATRAGVQPALVHYYFGSKADLLRAVVEELAASVVTQLSETAATGDNSAERLGEFVRGIVEKLGANPYAPRLLTELVFLADDDFTEHFVDEFGVPNLETIGGVLAEGFASGEFRPVQPHFFIPQMMGMTLFFFLALPVLRRLFGIEAITPELRQQFAEATAELILYGIVGRDGART